MDKETTTVRQCFNRKGENPMISNRRRILILMGLALGCSMMMATPSYAVSIPWADWTSTNDTTTVDGFVAGVGVHFTGVLSPDLITPAQTAGGTDFWSVNRDTTYASSPIVDFGPPDSDIIRLTGGTLITQTLTFDEALINPVMAILSLGREAVLTTYDFDQDFTILTNGAGFFGGGGPLALQESAGFVLEGREGHGLIQFNGTFSSITWTVPTGENWHGFTIGGTPVPEPASLMLLGAGLAAIGIWRRKAAR
jgi:hypothetical protein